MSQWQDWFQQWSKYRRLIGYARPYVGRLIVGSLCGVVFAGSTTGLLVTARQVIENVFQYAAFHNVLLIAIMLPVLAVARGVGQFLSDYFIEWVGNRVVMDMRIQVFDHLQDLSVRFFSESKTGELISRTINDTMMIDRAVSVVLGDLVKQPFVMMGAVGFLVWLDWKLALASLVLFPVCIVPFALFGRRVRRYARHVQQHLGTLVSIMQETLVGIRIVKAFGMESHESERFASQCRLYFRRLMQVVRDKASIEPMIVFLSFIGLALVLMYARWIHMPVQDFFTFAFAMMMLYEPVKKLSKIHLVLQQTSASADRIFELLDTPGLITDRPDAIAFQGAVESFRFENVSFAYDACRVLRDIDLAVPAGRRVALVGSSGAGKTTLVNLILRFYDVTSGRLLLNDTDIRHFTLSSLRRQIGMVTQETILFNDSVAANIAYGQTDASHQAVEDAAGRANAHDFIIKMPRGYDTIIGERGVRLSGGQGQRLAIARAILRNPPILILDEATSALDTESERLVQAALDDLMEGRTVFAIAHRLSTIMHCDTIVVLEHGRIVELGTHSSLLEKNGIYRRLYDLQFSDVRDSK